LSRHILHDLAPDAEIKACPWYEPTVENGKEIITRAQRIHYAVHAGLPIAFVQVELKVDVVKTAKGLPALIKSFNKFTHLNEQSFDINDSDAESFAAEALEIFSQLYETIEDCRASTQSAYESYAREAISDVLYGSVHSEIDELSTHSSVSQVNVDEVTIDALDSGKVVISVSGSVDCHLQYGSDSDNENGDGAQSLVNCPFSCKYEADVRWPEKLSLFDDSLKIDNSSFYE
jgi:hypothetical protein